MIRKWCDIREDRPILKSLRGNYMKEIALTELFKVCKSDTGKYYALKEDKKKNPAFNRDEDLALCRRTVKACAEAVTALNK